MISVIVPVYNTEKYIARCVESILTQTYKDIEIILVNDGSSDSSGSICDYYAYRYPNNIKVFHIVNAGVTNARLYGIRHAQGEWIGFVDSDDEIDSDMYEILLRNAEKYNADISHCGYKMIFADGRIHYFHNTNKVYIQNNYQGIYDLLDGSLIEPGLCNKIYKKALFIGLDDKMGAYISIRNNEDLLMNFFLFKSSKCSVFEDVCKYKYIVREGSATRQCLNQHQIYDPIKVKKIILKNIPLSLKVKAYEAALYTCIYKYCDIIIKGKKENNVDLKRLQFILRKQKKMMKFLGIKGKILGYMIIYNPIFFNVVYKCYNKLFKKKIYE